MGISLPWEFRSQLNIPSLREVVPDHPSKIAASVTFYRITLLYLIDGAYQSLKQLCVFVYMFMISLFPYNARLVITKILSLYFTAVFTGLEKNS